MLAAEADSLVVVSGGDIRTPTRQGRALESSRYPAQTRFEKYRDLVPPLVGVSADGTLGRLIAQAEIVGVRTDAEGVRVPTASTWVWVELYEKRDGRWVRVGEASSLRPPPAGSGGP